MALYDRVSSSTATVGTGPVVPGAATPGFRPFSVVTNGDTVSYVLSDGFAWEVGRGTWNGTQLSRTPLWSSNSNGAISLSGNATVFIDALAEDLPFGGSANPTSLVGLTAKNGSALTFMRSDAAPALDVSISPTWTGQHTFNNPINPGALPTPTTSTLGGVKAVTAVAHQWVASVDTTGAHLLSQPAFTDISGTAQISQGGTSQTTALAARGVNGLNIESTTVVGDTNYAMLATDRFLQSNVAFTAARTWTLPLSSSVNPGTRLMVQCNEMNASVPLTIAKNAGDSWIYIIGSGTTPTSIVYTAPVFLEFISFGSSGWVLINATDLSAMTGGGTIPIAKGGTGQTTAQAARGSSGLNIESATQVGDAAYSMLATDRLVISSANFTAARTWTLPDVTTVNPGARIVVFAWGATWQNQLTVAAFAGQNISCPAIYTNIASITGPNNQSSADSWAVWEFVACPSVSTWLVDSLYAPIGQGGLLANAGSSGNAPVRVVGPKVARSASLLNVESSTLIGDASYTILATDRVVNGQVAFTAPRTWTLPAISSVNQGHRIIIVGAGSPTNTLTLACTGADKLYDMGSGATVASRVFTGIVSLELIALTNANGTYWCTASLSAGVSSGRNYVYVNLNGTNVTGLANAATTKVPLSNKVADPDGVFDAVTNRRFTPNIPGKYMIAAAVGFATTGAAPGPPLIFEATSQIFKNGAALFTGLDIAGGTNTTGINYGVGPVTGIVQMNGTTDYIELYAYINYFSTNTNGTASAANVAGILGTNADTYFTAIWIGP